MCIVSHTFSLKKSIRKFGILFWKLFCDFTVTPPNKINTMILLLLI